MRAAPSIQVAVCRFGIWRTGLLLVGIAAELCLGAWLIDRSLPASAWLWCVGMATSAGMWAAIVSLWREASPFGVRWDGQCWQMWRLEVAACMPAVLDSAAPSQRASLNEADMADGDMTVAIDLGSWLLLRFEGHGNAIEHARTARRWLPVQRSGLDSQWHALRCTLYSRAGRLPRQPLFPDA